MPDEIVERLKGYLLKSEGMSWGVKPTIELANNIATLKRIMETGTVEFINLDQRGNVPTETSRVSRSITRVVNASTELKGTNSHRFLVHSEETGDKKYVDLFLELVSDPQLAADGTGRMAFLSFKVRFRPDIYNEVRGVLRQNPRRAAALFSDMIHKRYNYRIPNEHFADVRDHLV